MHQWSTTPLDNQTADARAQFQEGQPASSLNNGSRGMMATAALWRDDNLGILLTSNTGSNVYAVTTGQGLIDPTTVSATPAITKPFSLKLAFNAAITGVATNAPKLTVDGTASVPLVRSDGSALVDGDIVAGVPYEVLGDTVTGGAYSRARVLDVLPSQIAALIPIGFPIGAILPFAGNNFPTGFVLAAGYLLNRSDYAKLWTHAQNSGFVTSEANWNSGFAYQGYFTDGNGSSTFRIPALHGTFLRAADYGRGLDPGRTLGSSQLDAFRSHTHSLTQGGVVISGYAGTFPANVATGPYLQIDTIASTGGAETRPVNVAYPFLIRAY